MSNTAAKGALRSILPQQLGAGGEAPGCWEDSSTAYLSPPGSKLCWVLWVRRHFVLIKKNNSHSLILLTSSQPEVDSETLHLFIARCPRIRFCCGVGEAPSTLSAAGRLRPCAASAIQRSCLQPLPGPPLRALAAAAPSRPASSSGRPAVGDSAEGRPSAAFRREAPGRSCRGLGDPQAESQRPAQGCASQCLQMDLRWPLDLPALLPPGDGDFEMLLRRHGSLTSPGARS